MTSRERVKRALQIQAPDRIPHYLPDGKENDIRWLAPWTVGLDAMPPDKIPWKTFGEVDRRIDASGVTWERPAGKEGNIGLAKAYPINDITEQASYQFSD